MNSSHFVNNFVIFNLFDVLRPVGFCTLWQRALWERGGLVSEFVVAKVCSGRGVIQAYVGKSEDRASELGVYIGRWTG